MKRKENSDFERFDSTMTAILSTSHGELQKRIADEKKRKAKSKKRLKTSGASREAV